MGNDDYEILPHNEIEELRKEVAQIKKNPYGDGGRNLQDSIEKLTVSIEHLVSILEDAQSDIIDEYQESKPVEKMNTLLDQNETIAKAILTLSEMIKKPVQSQTQQSLQQLNSQNDFSQSAPLMSSNPLPIPDPQPDFGQQLPTLPQNMMQNNMMQQNSMNMPSSNFGSSNNQQGMPMFQMQAPPRPTFQPMQNSMPGGMTGPMMNMQQPRQMSSNFPPPANYGSQNNIPPPPNMSPMNFPTDIPSIGGGIDMSMGLPSNVDLPPLDVPKPPEPKKKLLGLI